MENNGITIVKKGKQIFPNIKCLKGGLVNEHGDTEFHIILETYVRKEHEGKYYLIPVYKRSVFNAMDLYTLAYDQFIQECYKVMLLYKISGNVITANGTELVIEDTNTKSEQDRIKELYLPML